ncbi:Cell wall protein PRY3 [Diplonema papillatum]|nr:Cell wall protein PRY3 [Diplonema papillatum]
MFRATGLFLAASLVVFARGDVCKETSALPWCTAGEPLKNENGNSGPCKGKSPCRTTMADWQKESVLERHNTYRTKHGVCPLTWSDRLSEFATNSVGFQKTCNTQQMFHNDPPRDPDTDAYLGENLGMVANNKELQDWDPAQSVMLWYCGEEPCYDVPTHHSNPSFMATGHFTQVIWKATSEVGCGLCHVASGSMYKKYVICSYALAGNFAGQNGANIRAAGTVAAGCSDPQPPRAEVSYAAPQDSAAAAAAVSWAATAALFVCAVWF